MKHYFYPVVLLFCCLWYFDPCFSLPVKVVHVDTPGELGNLLGDDRNEIDSIAVTGMLDADDLRTLNRCCQEGELSVIDLGEAQLAGDTIPERAFFLAKIGVKKGLQKIVFPRELKKIGDFAFGRSGLMSVELPATLRELGRGTFEATYLSGVLTIPEGLEVIPRSCFASCSYLEKVVLPATIRILEPLAFNGAFRMREINLPEGLTKIGMYCFSGTGLREIQVPNTVTEVGKMSFSDNDSLISVRLSVNLDSLPEQLFWDNPLLTRIVLPPHLRVIGDGVFEDCGQLEALYVPCGTPSDVKNPDRPSENPFRELTARCTLYVPVGAKEKYRSANYWKEFYRIEESSRLPSGIETDAVCKYRFYTRKYTVVIESETGQSTFYELYSLSGTLLKQGWTTGRRTEIILPERGIYLIKTDGETRKIVL